MPQQNYEDYWKITNAFTDYNGDGFLTTLKITIDFIDAYKTEIYSNDKYERLQNVVQNALKIDLISVRKAINQLVKMGFMNSFLVSYHADAREYVNAKTNRKRKSLLSKIVYSNSSFNRSVKNESPLMELNFLIKTLIEHGKLSKKEIIALMLVDIGSIEKGYLDQDELAFYVEKAEKDNFIERKYNQIGYLRNILGKLEDIVFVKDDLYFEDDAKNIFGDELKEERKLRDPYLHRLYKNQLKEESNFILGSTQCMLEKLTYPVLIASHIKPFIKSSPQEAYDANNGILLSRNMDALFDLGYITFDNTGVIILLKSLSFDVKTVVSNYKLDEVFLTTKRKEYLDFHRKEVFEKRFATAF